MVSAPTTAIMPAAVSCGSLRAKESVLARYSFIMRTKRRQYRCSIEMTSEDGPLRGVLEHAMLQLHPAAAELRNQHFRMGREDDDRGAVEKALDPPPRLLPERRVAGADPLVDQQNIFMRGGRDGEGQPREHAGRIGAHRQRQEIAELGEFGDIVELGRDLAPAHAHHVAAQINILEAGRFRVHPGMGVEQRTDSPLDGDGAAARLVDAGEHAQQRRLARAVMADKADAIAIVDLEVKTCLLYTSPSPRDRTRSR